MKPEKMTIQRAFEIVIELAEQNSVDLGDDMGDLDDEAIMQADAIVMVDEFAENLKRQQKIILYVKGGIVQRIHSDADLTALDIVALDEDRDSIVRFSTYEPEILPLKDLSEAEKKAVFGYDKGEK